MGTTSTRAQVQRLRAILELYVVFENEIFVLQMERIWIFRQNYFRNYAKNLQSQSN